MFDYIKDLIPVGRFNRPGNKMSPEYITIHDTANTSPGANALMHARYLKTVTKEVSWHYTVDDTTVVQHLPWNEAGWHTGTSQGNGNSIGAEICMNSDGNRAKAEENAQLLCVGLMKETGIALDHIVQHNHWSGKNCPQVLRARANGWANFIEGIDKIIHPVVPIILSAQKEEGTDNMTVVKVTILGKTIEGYMIDDKVYVPIREYTDTIKGAIDEISYVGGVTPTVEIK
jgi:N-acetylmuramoyl-L-alanine amidase